MGSIMESRSVEERVDEWRKDVAWIVRRCRCRKRRGLIYCREWGVLEPPHLHLPHSITCQCCPVYRDAFRRVWALHVIDTRILYQHLRSWGVGACYRTMASKRVCRLVKCEESKEPEGASAIWRYKKPSSRSSIEAYIGGQGISPLMSTANPCRKGG